MFKMLRMLFVFFLAGLLTSSCTSAVDFDQEYFSSRANRISYFDMDLFSSIAENVEGNIVVSPASVKGLLILLLEGVGGTTAYQIRNALRLPNNMESARDKAILFFSSLRDSNEGFVVENANRLFVSQNLPIKKSFVRNLKNNYLTEVVNIDFKNSQETSNNINEWVKMFTRGLIPKLVEPENIPQNSHIMLANAIFFKGKWALPFDRESTRVRKFCKSQNNCEESPMMETVDTFYYSYINNLDSQVLEMSYQGNRFSMIIILPRDPNNNLKTLIDDLPHNQLDSIVNQLKPTDIKVSVPRFTIAFNSDLTQDLKRLGISEIFSQSADLSKMIKGNNSYYVNSILHKAVIKTNEEGTVAASSSGAFATPLIGGSVIPSFNANHSFIFIIRDKQLGNVLFVGKVTEPEIWKPGQPLHESQITFQSNSQETRDYNAFKIDSRQQPKNQPNNQESTQNKEIAGVNSHDQRNYQQSQSTDYLNPPVSFGK